MAPDLVVERPDRSERLARAAPIAPAALAAVAYAALAVFRHDRFGSGGYDLGIFDQTVWGYSRFEIVHNTVKRVPNLLEDHFHPILVALAPFYWVWSNVRVLLVAQALLLAVASLPLYAWAREQLGTRAALFVQAAFLLFWGLLAGDLFDFHELAFAVPTVSLGLYAALTKRDRLLWAAVALGAVTKEDVPLTFLALGLYVALAQRRWRLGLAVAAVCAAWTTLLLTVVMPALASRAYGYWTYSGLGHGPGSAFVGLIRHPLERVRLLIDPTRKLETLAELLGAWLFLPLVSPIALIGLPALAERFWSSNPMLWEPRYQYSLVLAPILGFAAVDTLARFHRRLPPIPAAAALAGAAALMTFVVVQPLTALDRRVSARRAAAIESCLRTIPAGASVTAQSALIPHLTHRRAIYPLVAGRRESYLAVDFSTAAGRLNRADRRRIVERARAEGYRESCARGTTVVLRLPRTRGESSAAAARER